ncbi:MAG: DNA-methyltransferase [Candidatus Heimdallarchaeaceae archaeon]
MSTGTKKKGKKRKKSLPFERFKPTYNWSKVEAKELYQSRVFPFEVDRVEYRDCISGMQDLPSESIDMIIADPPFGLNFNGREPIYNRNKNNVIEGYKEVKIVDYSNFTDSWIKELPRIMKREAGVWIFSGWTNLKDILIALEKYKLHIINHIIWKYQFGVFTRKKFVTSHYHILFAVKQKRDYFFNKVEHYPLDVWEIKRDYHSRQKKNATKLPVKVVQRCIDFGSKPGDLVLDPFMGNGTTAVACKGSFRHFYGFEINKVSEEIIKYNIEQATEGEAYTPYSQRKQEKE